MIKLKIGQEMKKAKQFLMGAMSWHRQCNRDITIPETLSVNHKNRFGIRKVC